MENIIAILINNNFCDSEALQSNNWEAFTNSFSKIATQTSSARNDRAFIGIAMLQFLIFYTKKPFGGRQTNASYTLGPWA